MMLFLLVVCFQAGPEPRLDGDRVVVPLTMETIAALRAIDPSKAQWQQMLAVYLAPAPTPNENRPPIGGRYVLASDGLVFGPHFPFYPGREHIARFDRGVLAEILGQPSRTEILTTSFTVPAPEPRTPQARVLSVRPVNARLPSNLLRFYVTFSEPMTRHGSRDRIYLLDSEGTRVHAPFLSIGPELWDPEGRRLTLLFDPGRIKRGLRPHLEAGPPLLPGGSYTLVIPSDLVDASGTPLIESHRFSFQTSEPDRTSPNWSKWRFTPPTKASKEALVIHFDEIMDSAIALRGIHLTRAGSTAISGRTVIIEEGRGWSLVPDRPWQEGEYTLHVSTSLEDLAGNRFFRRFDEETVSERPPSSEPEEVARSFRIE